MGEKMGVLVCRAQAGEQDAWTVLYNATVKEAYFIARKIAPQDEAEDLVQEAYLIAYTKLNTLEEPEKFRSWLNMIVANRCRDYLKKHKPLLFSELETEDGPELDWADEREDAMPEATLDHQETVRLVAQMIEDLPEDQRLCVLLYYREELSVGQIAQALGVSEGTVKSRLNYARQKVKTKVESLEKQGVKLYGMAPLPFLLWLLRCEAQAMELPAGLANIGGIGLASSAGYGYSAKTAVAGAGKIAAAGGLKGLTAKVVAGVLAVSVAAGGAEYYFSAGDENSVPEQETECTESEILEDGYWNEERTIESPYFSMMLPRHWGGRVRTELKIWEDGCTFVAYDSASKDAGWGGYLFEVITLPAEEDYSHLPATESIGVSLAKEDEIRVLAGINPTEIQYSKETEAGYLELMEDVPRIIEKIYVKQQKEDGGMEMFNLNGKKVLSTGAAVALSLIMTGCSSQGNPTEYLDVSFSGVDTRGECQVELDLERMTIAALGKSESEMDSWEGLGEYLEMYDVLYGGVDVEVDMEEGLSNGDKVTVSIDCDDEAEKYFKSAEVLYTVEGLTEAIEVDPFEYLKVTYDGITGDAAMELENTAEDEGLSKIRFNAEKMFNISSGDEIEITASLADQYSEEYGYLLSETSKTVTVPELNYYISTPDLITKDVIQEILDANVPKYTYESNEYWGYSEPVYYDSYFVNIFDSYFSVNKLVVYMKFESWSAGDEANRETRFVELPYSDVVATPDGKILLDHNSVWDCEDIYFVDMETKRAAMETDWDCEWFDIDF